jgi:hypothetical protein
VLQYYQHALYSLVVLEVQEDLEAPAFLEDLVAQLVQVLHPVELEDIVYYQLGKL